MRGLAFLLALAPLFPPLAGLALFFVPWVRRLPLWGQALLALYGASLLLPALFAPEPLAWPLALFRFLYVLGLISLSIALLNLLPFLPLDGGHIAFAVVEGARGRTVAREVYERVSIVGIGLVVLLFVIGLTNDIGRLS